MKKPFSAVTLIYFSKFSIFIYMLIFYDVIYAVIVHPLSVPIDISSPTVVRKLA